ncbi:ABC transporter permease subunit [Rhizobium sp. RU36D]|uniref:ABC transporter permease n=1 Tax=Rhizobium sp. RU36D TaxID=1907415 RepID=UPI0009FD724E|nr:ABC transporter permease subunit [Rhizobium sp. RU36D]
MTWEASLLVWPTSSESFAPPHAVAGALFQALLDGTILIATLQTLLAAIGGLAIGGALGLAIGVLFGLSRLMDQLLEVTIEAIRPVPSIAILPIAMMIFGFGYRMEIAIVAFASIWPMMIMSRSAVRDLEPRLFDVARVLRLTPRQTITKLVLPAIAGRVFVALRLAAGVALIVAITTEIAANPMGLGAAIMAAQQTFRPELMLALLVWIGLVGYAWNAVLLACQDRLIPAARAKGSGHAQA